MRGIGAELKGSLIGGLAKVREEVADLLFTGVDDLARRSSVDGAGHVLTELLKAATQLLEQSVRRHGGFGNHGLLPEGKTKPQHVQRAQLSFPSS